MKELCNILYHIWSWDTRKVSSQRDEQAYIANRRARRRGLVAFRILLYQIVGVGTRTQVST